MGDGVGHGHTLEVVYLASAQDGRQNLVLLGGGEDEDHVRWRLLQRLKEGIEGSGAEHVYLVDDEHLVLAHLRRDAGLLHQGLDVVHTIVAGGVQLKDVVRALLVERLAALARHCMPRRPRVGCSQLIALAKMRAQVVFPTPLGPQKR